MMKHIVTVAGKKPKTTPPSSVNKTHVIFNQTKRDNHRQKLIKGDVDIIFIPSPHR
ncbi:ketosynthase [Vibrio cholerae HC-46B1]|nr:ketosynthase [Vibrio furnissii NCTC 11218]EJH52483.1 hypothetical protein VCHC43B1_2270 [Vibrio cholerae HC-43B1]EKL03693.1 hypothetical protein VCHC41B1_1240 [Vibrio cholerae HC-41B1]EKL97249.1 ketosynthase [Vibrio cholerae HC-46B1]EKM04736.1 ketosynthase [Vibrio cholerae HC-44C1]EMP93369.1 putative ketosynthase [Vibrio cholerae O1 str. 116063]CFW04946.1 FIG01206494: hypothetical protein [Vibrio cholerae]